MKVELSPGARDDLNKIAEEIAKDSPAAAERFVADIERLATTLRRFPDRGTSLEGWRDTRRLLLGKYLILYKVGPAMVDIVRIIHSARDIKTVVAGDERFKSDRQE
ncbi:MAG TPA: type II toxin-antitoxin system RelE/ParE family toxin [Beijerinckiaceae bacterium]|jgi:toxin ParE1/3/4|nr:type II toxin-antitoxin system RelE/ParE family toxin [Beijerinckiaceae bacterium]